MSALSDIAKAYHAMPSTPDDRVTRDTWHALAVDCRVTAWDAVTYRLDHYRITSDPEPYPAAELMIHDVLVRRSFTVSRANCGHPLWSESANIAFRTAHDIWGHVDADSGFDYAGELAACAAHGRWIRAEQPTPERVALFVECIMQTATAIHDGRFPDQKVNADPGRYMSPPLRRAFARWLRDPTNYHDLLA